MISSVRRRASAVVAFVAAAVCMFFYPISRELNQKIADELTERRKGFAP